MALYLHCVICSRKQADGIVSGKAWGKLDVPTGVAVDHPGLRGSHFRCCPTCAQRHPDWQAELLTSLGLAGEQDTPQAAAQ